MWSWIGAACLASFQKTMALEDAISLSKLTTFLTIGVGGFACVFGGKLADKFGKRRITLIAMTMSGLSCLAFSGTFGGQPFLSISLAILWGMTIIPDSPQFSAIVADHAPPRFAGSILTAQTALGFALTIVTVQIVPFAVQLGGWPFTIGAMAIGPAFGIWAMTQISESANRLE